MALARWGARGHALAAMAGAGAAGAFGGGGARVAWMAIQAARDPEVQEVVRDVRAAGASAAAAAASWINETILESESLDEGGMWVCVGRWYFYLGVIAIVVSFMLLAAASACCCGPLGFVCGHTWARRQAPRPAAAAAPAAPAATAAPAAAAAPTTTASQPAQPGSYQHLSQLAAFLATGGPPALDAAAQQLAVPRENVQAWWVHWQLAHSGPRRK